MQPSAQPDSPRLASHLADRDVPCHVCGYNLRGISSPFCPECETVIPVPVSKAPQTCPCGYSLRGLDAAACPECGRPVTQPKHQFWHRMLDRASRFILVFCAIALVLHLAESPVSWAKGGNRLAWTVLGAMLAVAPLAARVLRWAWPPLNFGRGRTLPGRVAWAALWLGCLIASIKLLD